MRKRLPRSRFNQDVIVTDAERKKLKDTYCSGINEIKNVFDYVIDYQNRSNNSRFYDEYNYIRIASVILRIYEVSIEDIIRIKIDDVDIKNNTINLSNGNSIIIDHKLFEYIEKAMSIKYPVDQHLVYDSRRLKFTSKDGFINMTNNFKTYVNTVLQQNDMNTISAISYSSLRDSIRFEKVLNRDKECKFSHNFYDLKTVLKSEFITKECTVTNTNLKIRTKYDLYLKWFKVFYEEAAWENGEF